MTTPDQLWTRLCRLRDADAASSTGGIGRFGLFLVLSVVVIVVGVAGATSLPVQHAHAAASAGPQTSSAHLCDTPIREQKAGLDSLGQVSPGEWRHISIAASQGSIGRKLSCSPADRARVTSSVPTVYDSATQRLGVTRISPRALGGAAEAALSSFEGPVIATKNGDELLDAARAARAAKAAEVGRSKATATGGY